MRTLFFVVAVLAALYAGYWFVGSSQVETRAEAALADLAAEGWQVDYESLNTTGFPSRFDTTLTELDLASPDGSCAWEAPFVQVFALSYRPNRVIAVWPTEQRLTVAGQPLVVSAQGLRASAAFGLSGDLPLDHATVESGLSAVEADAGWGFGLDRLLAAIRRAGPKPNSYDIYLEANGLRPAAVSANIGLLRLDTQVTLEAPLDRRLQDAPQLVALRIKEARLAQGDVALTATGELAPDAQGFLAGTVTLRAENWRGLLDLLAAAGVLVYDQAPLVASALEQLAGGRETIEVPVTFRDGQVEALGVVLLQAPQVL